MVFCTRVVMPETGRHHYACKRGHLLRPNSCERTNTWPYITGSVLLQSSFYEGRADHHVTKIIHDHPLARPLIQVEEFAASGHHILHIWAHQSAALWS